MKAPWRFADTTIRSGIAKATFGWVLATSSRYSSAANSSSENVCGRTEKAAATSPQLATARAAWTTVSSGNPPRHQMP